MHILFIVAPCILALIYFVLCIAYIYSQFKKKSVIFILTACMTIEKLYIYFYGTIVGSIVISVVRDLITNSEKVIAPKISQFIFSNFIGLIIFLILICGKFFMQLIFNFNNQQIIEIKKIIKLEIILIDNPDDWVCKEDLKNLFFNLKIVNEFDFRNNLICKHLEDVFFDICDRVIPKFSDNKSYLLHLERVMEEKEKMYTSYKKDSVLILFTLINPHTALKNYKRSIKQKNSIDKEINNIRKYLKKDGNFAGNKSNYEKLFECYKERDSINFKLRNLSRKLLYREYKKRI